MVLDQTFRPALEAESHSEEKPYTFPLAGRTCLAGDVVGDYSFDHPIAPGEWLEFQDMAIYTMVKNNTFNGMKLPDIVLEDQGDYQIIRSFGYDEFKRRL